MRRTNVIAVVAAFGMVFSLPCRAAETTGTVEARAASPADSAGLRRARDAHEKGNYDTAVREYRTILAQRPEDDTARLGLVQSLSALKNYREAEKEVEVLLKQNPDSSDALLLRGNIRLWQKDFGKSRIDLERVVSLAPEYCDAWLSLARSYLWDGDTSAALTQLERAPAACRSHDEYSDLLKQIRAAETVVKDSRSRTEAAAVEPTDRETQPDFDALIRYARSLSQRKDYAGAENIIDDILAVKPDHSDALLLKGLVALWTDRESEAEYYFNRTLSVAPDYCEAYYGLSNVMIRRKDFPAARESIFRNPSCPCTAEGIAQQARVENADGNYAHAKELFAQAVAMEPENKDFQEGITSIRLFTNTAVLAVEDYHLSGRTTVFSDVLVYRPCKQLLWEAAVERWKRFGSSDERLGLGTTWHPRDDFWLTGRALVAREREIVPSRYSTELIYRLLEDPGTYLEAGSFFYEGKTSDSFVHYLGLRQSFCEFWSVAVRRNWARQVEPTIENGVSDSLRLSYEKEKERNVSVGLASGDELFDESRPDQAAISGTYHIKTVFVNWREWIRDDWGVVAGVTRTERATGNDSRGFTLGVFFEF